jgi:hypothetical protein
MTTPPKIGGQVWIYGHGQPRKGSVVELGRGTVLVHYDTPNGRRHTKRVPQAKCYETYDQLMVGEFDSRYQPPQED